MADGHLAAAEDGARHLHAAFPTLSYPRNLCLIFDQLPGASDGPPFVDDPAKEVQIVPRDDAESVLLLFCGGRHRLGGPLPLLHRWFAGTPAHLIYLRDFQRLFYLSGVPSLGPERAATLAALRNLVKTLGGKRILCYGNSAGAFAALHYAVDLGAEAVVTMAGPTNLEVGFNAHLSYHHSALRVRELAPGATVDLRRAYEQAERPPRALLVYGDANWDDRLHAENMAELPTVTLAPLEGTSEHNVVTEVLRERRFDEILQWLV
jgi:hypothetical protein